MSWRKMAKLFANSGDPDQTPHDANKMVTYFLTPTDPALTST